MPRTKKPAGTAVRPYNGRRADLVPVQGGRFDPPDGLSEQARVLWDLYWDDTVATVITVVDRGLLTRWISEYDRYLRTIAEADQEPLVRGSTGQPAENPLYRIAYRALDAAERCERQMGIGPLHRSSLGIAVITERRSLADMNIRYGGGDDNRRPVEAEARTDPRVIEAEA